MKKGFVHLPAILVITLIVIVGFAVYSKNRDSEEITPAVLTFEECIKVPNTKAVDSYPKKCVTDDGKIFIEEVKEPVDTASFDVFDAGLGFSFKCPPSWSCKKNENDSSVYVDSGYYLNISTFNFRLITNENFQKSGLRHPNYKNPVDWFEDLQAKKKIAIKVFPETILPMGYTDGLSYPDYNFFTLEEIDEVETNMGKGLAAPVEEHNDHIVIIPLNNTTLIYVTLSPPYLYENPIIKAIISSISGQ